MKKNKVLIADSSRTSRSILESTLEEAGLECVSVENGLQAWEALNQSEPPQIIVVDWFTPVISGLELCKKIRNEYKASYVYIIIVTSKNEDQDRWLGIEAGADDYVIKSANISKELSVRMSIAKRILDYQNELQTLNNDLNTFLSILAHDIKGAFGVLLNISIRIPSVIKSNDEKKISEFVNKWKGAVKTTYQLFENLLQWSMSRRNKTELNVQKYNLSEILKDEFSHLSLRCQEKNIKLEVQLSDCEIKADKDTLNTVVRNLVSNAIKFTPAEGGIKIYCSEPEDKSEGSMLYLCVEDSGVGMDDEKVKSLFHIGHNRSTKGTAQESGTGLGLLLCKELIEKNGGNIWVKSQINMGSQFFISIPLSVAEIPS